MFKMIEETYWLLVLTGPHTQRYKLSKYAKFFIKCYGLFPEK